MGVQIVMDGSGDRPPRFQLHLERTPGLSVTGS